MVCSPIDRISRLPSPSLMFAQRVTPMRTSVTRGAANVLMISSLLSAGVYVAHRSGTGLVPTVQSTWLDTGYSVSMLSGRRNL